MKFKEICLTLVLTIWSTMILAVRDPFSLSNTGNDECNLNKLLPADLNFSGSVFYDNHSLAFIEDPLGEVCQILIGDRIGFGKYEVIDISSDQVMLSNGQQFMTIK